MHSSHNTFEQPTTVQEEDHHPRHSTNERRVQYEDDRSRSHEGQRSSMRGGYRDDMDNDEGYIRVERRLVNSTAIIVLGQKNFIAVPIAVSAFDNGKNKVIVIVPDFTPDVLVSARICVPMITS